MPDEFSEWFRLSGLDESTKPAAMRAWMEAERRLLSENNRLQVKAENAREGLRYSVGLYTEQPWMLVADRDVDGFIVFARNIRDKIARGELPDLQGRKECPT